MAARTAQESLDNLAEALVKDLLATPDGELLAEAAEDGQDVAANAAKCREQFAGIVAKVEATKKD